MDETSSISVGIIIIIKKPDKVHSGDEDIVRVLSEMTLPRERLKRSDV